MSPSGKCDKSESNGSHMKCFRVKYGLDASLVRFAGMHVRDLGEAIKKC